MKRKILLTLMLFISLFSLSSCGKKENNITKLNDKLSKYYSMNYDYKPNWYSIRGERRYYGNNESHEKIIDVIAYADLNGSEFKGTFEEAKVIETSTIVKYDEGKVISNTIEKKELICKNNNLFIKQTSTDLLTNEIKTTTFGSSTVEYRGIFSLTHSFKIYNALFTEMTDGVHNTQTPYVSDDLKTFNVYDTTVCIENALSNGVIWDAVGLFSINFDNEYNPIKLEVNQIKNFEIGESIKNGYESRRVIATALNEAVNIEVPTDYDNEYEFENNHSIGILV